MSLMVFTRTKNCILTQHTFHFLKMHINIVQLQYF